MSGFSREATKLEAIMVKQRRARCQAKGNSSSMKLKHPDWCRDAAKGDFTMLNKKIKEDCEKAQEQHEKFRSKLHAIK